MNIDQDEILGFTLDFCCLNKKSCKHDITLTMENDRIKSTTVTGRYVYDLHVKFNKPIPEHFQRFSKRPGRPRKIKVEDDPYKNQEDNENENEIEKMEQDNHGHLLSEP